MSDPIYMHGLRVSNFLRLDAVDLSFNGAGLEIVAGANASGKSSLLRAIWAALAGRDALPDEPVRRGAAKAEVKVDLGDRVVSLKIKPDRTTTLTIESKEGSTFKRPQQLLDEMVGALAFDPTQFADLPAKEQAVTLRKMVGLDTSDLDARRAKVYEERTRINREAKALAVQVDSVVVPPEPAPVLECVIGEEFDMAALAKEQADAMALQREIDEAKRGHEQVRLAILAHVNRIDEIDDEIRKLHEERATHAAAVTAREPQLVAMTADIAGVTPPDMSAIAARFGEAQRHNADVRTRHENAAALERTRTAAVTARQVAAAQRAQRQADLAAKTAEADAMTAEIAAIDGERNKRLSAATFPLPGLSVDGDAVIYQDHPLSQASSAEQLQISLAIAAALNPRLRLLLVRAGNDLDTSRLRQVADWAKANAYQILLERCTGDQAACIEIVEGRAIDNREK